MKAFLYQCIIDGRVGEAAAGMGTDFLANQKKNGKDRSSKHT
jgi:hypothetical protein